MIELGGRARFLVKALDVLGIGRHFRRQDFQGDEAVELRVAGAEHGRHAADADGLEQLKMGQRPPTDAADRRLRARKADETLCGRRLGDDRRRVVGVFAEGCQPAENEVLRLGSRRLGRAIVCRAGQWLFGHVEPEQIIPRQFKYKPNAKVVSIRGGRRRIVQKGGATLNRDSR